MESIVFLHGFSGTRHAWDETIARLPPERYTPLALDLPGHGDQSAALRPIDFNGCVASVLERSPDRFALVGYSMGGRVALHLAFAAPARISQLVLVAATAGIEDPLERARRRAHDRRLADRIERQSIAEFAALWQAQPMFARDPPEVGALARADQARNRPDAIAAALRGIGTGEMCPLWDRLGELSMSTSVVVGRRDLKFRELGERMASLLPEASVAILPGGHRLPYEHPDLIARAIVAGASRG